MECNFEKTGKRLAALVLLLGASLNAQAASYILTVIAGTDGARLAARYGLRITRTWTEESRTSFALLSTDPLSSTALAALKSESGVRGLEVDTDLHTAETEPSSRAKVAPESLGSWFSLRARADFFGAIVHDGYVHQPGLTLVRADEAHQKFAKGAGVIAIIDTGVDTSHAALRQVLIPGYDFTRDRSDTVSELNDLDPATAAALQQSTVEILDSSRPAVQLNATTVAILSQSTVEILDGAGLPGAFGHGTMIAGLIHRVAPEARIMPLKAFRADGSASLSNIVRAIRFAVDNGAKVINMSFSFSAPSAELLAAIQYATSRNVICVASAGNNGKEAAVYPAAWRQVIGVGSTNYSDRRSGFSNYGSSARTSAPGEAILTTFPGNTYAGVWGTSFSTALVSGALAVYRQVSPGLKSDEWKDALNYGARIDQDMGDARLDLVRTLTYLQKR